MTNKKESATLSPSLNPSDSTEPFGPEWFDLEFTTKGLTADGLVAGHQGREDTTPPPVTGEAGWG